MHNINKLIMQQFIYNYVKCQCQRYELLRIINIEIFYNRINMAYKRTREIIPFSTINICKRNIYK